MEFSLMILRQTILMSLYMLIGYLLYRGIRLDTMKTVKKKSRLS